MSQPVRQFSFASGEIAPYLFARTEINRYENGLRTMRNTIAMRHGGATNRPGSQYVGTTLNGGKQVRFIPFIFNETGVGQSYVLELGNAYIAFYQNAGVIKSGGVPYTISTPYLQADLQDLKYAQSADIVTITHQNYPPMELRRLGQTNWTLTTIAFQSSIGGPVMLPTSGGGAGGFIYLYAVTAVSQNGDETDTASVHTVVTPGVAQASPTNPITVAWTSLPGAITYRVYKQDSTAAGVAIPGLGFIGTTVLSSFADTGITPDYSNNIPQYNQLFVGVGNYPSAVGYAQQRRAFADTVNNPLGFWMSRTGSPSNFDVHINGDDSDPIISSIAGEEVNQIQHIIEQKFMLIMTEGAELYVQGNGNGVVTPSSVNASTQSQYGASKLQPLKVGDVVLFNQALGSFVRDFAFDFSIDGYRGNDITIFSSHLFENYQLMDWAFQKIPDSIIWAARSDGQLLGCTYIREQQILAWHRHDFINGTVENVCAIPENGGYAIYLAIKRFINGITVRYVERMSSRLWTDPIDATYLDCFLTYDGRNNSGEFMVLGPISGTFVEDDTAYQQQLTLSTNGVFFTPGMIGDQIFLSDALFISSQGAKGNQVRCIIQAYTSPFVVTVTPNKIVPNAMRNTPIFLWSRAVKTVSGLDHLEGQQVSVWADRYVVGSPLNSNVSNSYTVTGGSITLDKCYSVIHVGLPIVSDLETLDIETSFGETQLSKRKRVAKLGLYLYKTRDFFAGSENPDNNLNNTTGDPLFELDELKLGTNRTVYDEPPDMVTGQDYIIIDTRWNRNGRLFIRNVDPLPMTILAVAPMGEWPVQQAYGTKV